MADEWLKLRHNIWTDPKTIRLAARVGELLNVTVCCASRDAQRDAQHNVTRDITQNVTRDVAVSCLLRVWAAANQHTSDGVFTDMVPEDLDHIAGVVGFGQAMVAAGWAVFDVENSAVVMPNFLQLNTPAKSGQRAAAAERQRKYRERQAQRSGESDASRDAQRDVTGDVTSQQRDAPRIRNRIEVEIEQTTNDLPLKVDTPIGDTQTGGKSVWLDGFVFSTKSGEQWGLTRSELDQLRGRWPEIDIEHELRLLAAWSLDHAASMPRASDMPGYLRNCLRKKFTEGNFKAKAPPLLPPAARRTPQERFELERCELVKSMRRAGATEADVDAAVAKLEAKVLGKRSAAAAATVGAGT